jgi:hypothetical protein
MFLDSHKSICLCYRNKFTSILSDLPFDNPTHKTKTGIANSWGTTNSKTMGTDYYDEPIKRHYIAVRSYLLHSFLQLHSVVLQCPFSSNHKLCNHAGPQPFSPTQTSISFTLLRSILMCNITYWAQLEILLYVTPRKCPYSRWEIGLKRSPPQEMRTYPQLYQTIHFWKYIHLS